MGSLVVVGMQYGDEGKGKLTDYFALNSDVVIRYQGGNNAGHTIIFNSKKFKLSAIPSGVFNPKVKNIMANGVVLNPKVAIEELNMLKEQGIADFKLYISNKASLIMPFHLLLDGAYEDIKGGKKIGTTKKGIGPCYADKANRIGLRVGDLLDEEYFKERLTQNMKVKEVEFKSLGLKPLNIDDVYDEYMMYAKILKEYICDTSLIINEALKNDEKVLFEGAQGTMLCLEHGSYPYVTSSSPTAAAIPLYTGVAPRYINNVLGVCKAYSTRVGEGPFVTQIHTELADEIRQKANEFGTVTRRPRKIGYLDAVMLNHAIRINGINHMSIMLLDVLSNVRDLKICTSYNLDGKVISYIPSTISEYERCTPNYVTLKGWTQDITNCKSVDELPKEAIGYIKKIEELTNTKVSTISVGPDRVQTINITKVF